MHPLGKATADLMYVPQRMHDFLPIFQQALKEDLGEDFSDLTSQASIAPDAQTTLEIRSRQAGILCGVDVAAAVFQVLDAAVTIHIVSLDGTHIQADQTVLKVSGAARALLSAERTALNFLGRMTGIASETQRCVEVVKQYKAKICCTRKTTPLFRPFEKYAVQQGGGVNHRYGLFDAILIKDNHMVLAQKPWHELLPEIRRAYPSVPLEMEVDSLDQLDSLLPTLLTVKIDAVLCDNFGLKDLQTAVTRVAGQFPLEASGNITSETIAAFAATGVDFISMGRLTHSVKNHDFGLDYIR